MFASAYLPQNGQSLLDLAYQDADAITGHHLVYHEDGTVGMEAGALDDVFCHDCEPDMLSELEAHYRAEPGTPLSQPVTLTAARRSPARSGSERFRSGGSSRRAGWRRRCCRR